MRDETPSYTRLSWLGAVALVAVSSLIGFVVLAPFSSEDPDLGTWGAICRAIGIEITAPAARSVQPPAIVPTRIAWTGAVLSQVAAGRAEAGEKVALDCEACHGEGGVSRSELVPTLAGLDRAVLYKQLDDYRSGKRLWGVMSAVAEALGDRGIADVAAYYAGRTDGVRPVRGEGLPSPGRSLRQTDPTLRLVFVGDPKRGLPPCAACHGPGSHKLGAPPLEGQQAGYIARQLTAFADGGRQNDINQQMRVVAVQLTGSEIKGLAAYYGRAD